MIRSYFCRFCKNQRMIIKLNGLLQVFKNGGLIVNLGDRTEPGIKLNHMFNIWKMKMKMKVEI